MLIMDNMNETNKIMSVMNNLREIVTSFPMVINEAFN